MKNKLKLKPNQKAEIEQKKEEPKMDRRDFLVTVGNGALGLTAAGAAVGTYKYLFPNALLEPALMFNAGLPEHYKEGVDSRWLDKKRVFVVRRQKYIYSLIGICTHLGCIPPWRPGEGVFYCPCHGSIFAINGDVLRGPAREPLYRPPIEVKADGTLRIGTGLLGIRLPQQANLDPERSGTGFELTA